jgi:AcrR family transcriptional regulator
LETTVDTSRTSNSPDKLPSGRHDLPRDLIIQSQRDRILQAMAETVAANGYAASTVAEIVERAGVSRATFYELFRGKDDCVTAAANTLLGELVTVVTTQYSPDKPLVNVIRDAMAATLGLLSGRPAQAKMIFFEAMVSIPSVRQVYLSGVNVLLSLLDQIRVDGAPGTQTPPATARAAIGACEALIRNQIQIGKTEELPAILPDLLYGALVAYIGQDAALEQARMARDNPPQIELTPFGRAHI